jgi:uncharacterized protein YbjT (DUF2867 family)
MILVTGPTGRVGEQVVRTLRQLKLEAKSLVRKGSEYFWLNDTGTNYFFGDLRDELSISRATRDVDYLIVCSGVRLETQENNHTTVTLDGHDALFRIARERGIKRVIMLSCAGVDRGYSVPSFHARQGAEELLVSSGLDYTILRAPLHEQHFLEFAFRVRDRGSTFLPGPGDNVLYPISTRDLALMLVSSLDLEAVRNRTIDVGGLEAITPREAFDAACAALDVPASARALPGPAVALGSRLGRPIRRYANRLSEMSRWFSEDFNLDTDAMKATFNIPFQGFHAALAPAAQNMLIRRDPELREKHMVHPQFYATVYEPGVAKLEDMPVGPPPRRD